MMGLYLDQLSIYESTRIIALNADQVDSVVTADLGIDYAVALALKSCSRNGLAELFNTSSPGCGRATALSDDRMLDRRRDCGRRR
jgi:hypothetical protein